MPNAVERPGFRTNLLDEASIERAFLEWKKKPKEAKPQNDELQAKRIAKQTITESICFGCMRSLWSCLCDWPNEKPPGVKGITFKLASGEKLTRITSCPFFWPDTRGELDDAKTC